VVVFNQNGVEKSHAVIRNATGSGRVLFHGAHAGRGLAGIEDPATGSGDSLAKLTGERGDAAQALQEVQRNAFPLKEGARFTFDCGDDVARLTKFAIVLQESDTFEDLGKHFSPGEHQPFAREKCTPRMLLFRDASTRGDITQTNVFFESKADDSRHRKAETRFE
jgi:hypothetical protein